MPRKLSKTPAAAPPLSSSRINDGDNDKKNSDDHGDDPSHALSLAALSPILAASSATLPLPRLVVFDLDYTLWPFWVDTHPTPPLKPLDASQAAARDRYGEHFAFYADVPSILTALPCAGVRLAVASRTAAANVARDLLRMLHLPVAMQSASPPDPHADHRKKKPVGVNGNGHGGVRRALDVFDGGLEMYPTSKIRHFEAIRKRTGIAYEDMLFFDDEPRNRDTESLGVTMWLVRDGVSWAEVERGVEEWRRRRT